MNKPRGYLTPYKTYVFTDKDPIIDHIRSMIAKEGDTYTKVSERAGVCTTTLYNWFNGPTRRPQFASVMAVVRSLGYDLQVVQANRSPTSQKIYTILKKEELDSDS